MHSILEDALREIIRDEIAQHRKEFLTDIESIIEAAMNDKAGASSNAVYLTSAEAAELVGVSPTSIRNWVARGELQAHYAGRLLRVRRDELEAYISRDRPRDTDKVDRAVADERARDLAKAALRR